MDFPDVLLFILPLITTALASYYKLKSDEGPTFKRLTIVGWIVILFTLVYFTMGLFNLSSQNIEKAEQKKNIDSLVRRSDSLLGKLERVEDKYSLLVMYLEAIGHPLWRKYAAKALSGSVLVPYASSSF